MAILAISCQIAKPLQIGSIHDGQPSFADSGISGATLVIN